MAEVVRSAVLFILHAGDTYTVSLETPVEGPSVLASTVSVAAEDRQDILVALERAVGAGAPPGYVESDALPSVGRLMYSLFLPRSIQDFLRTWDGPLTVSTNDPAIPWELLHNGQDFIGVRHAVGRRLVSARTPPARISRRSERPTFLFIADPQGDLEGAAQEARHLVTILSRRGFPCDLLLAERASYLNVQEALGAGRYDVVHYAGHARFGQDSGEESALELAQHRLLPASQIERVLQGAPLVFLNACASGQTNAGDVEPMIQLGAATESLASAFIFGGAQGFIGTLWPVLDAGSRVFAAFFYNRVLAGDPVGEALRATRHHTRQEHPADATWASFVLYGDPVYRLWEHPDAVESDNGVAAVRSAERDADAQRRHRSDVALPAADRDEATDDVRVGRRRLIVGAVTILIVAGLLFVVGQQRYESIFGGTADLRGTVTPSRTAATVTETATAELATTASVTSVATRKPQPPTSTPPQFRYPPPQPAATTQTLKGRLAFVSNPESGLSTLYVMNADGSQLRELGPGVDPAWAPTGDTIAFAGLLEEERGIHLVRPDGTGLTRLTEENDWQPTWSPDGKLIAFMSHRDGNREIYIMNDDGIGVQRISNSPWEDRHPSWSPAGDQIAFISNRSGSWQIWVMNTDGGRQIRLTDNNYDNFRPVWSPDGKQITYGVWTGIRNEIWMMNADGSDEHRVTANAVYKQEFSGYGLAWEPQLFISFVSNRLGKPQIFVMNPDGSGQKLITSRPAGAFSPAWTLR